MGAKYLDAHLDVLAPNGRLVIIGFQGGTTATLDLRRLLAKRASISAASLRARPVSEKSAICAQVVGDIWPLLGDGTIRPTEHRIYPLAQAAEAHARLESGDHIGKIILQVAAPERPPPQRRGRPPSQEKSGKVARAGCSIDAVFPDFPDGGPCGRGAGEPKQARDDRARGAPGRPVRRGWQPRRR